MRTSLFCFCILLGSMLWSAAFAAQAPVVAPGDTLPGFTLPDQHGNQTSIADEARLILFSADKASADLVNEYLAKQDATFLADQQAYFLSDISAMPGMVTRMFALPKMRKRPYPILLAESEKTLALLPRKQSAVSVIRLRDGLVLDIGYAFNLQELGALLP